MQRNQNEQPKTFTREQMLNAYRQGIEEKKGKFIDGTIIITDQELKQECRTAYEAGLAQYKNLHASIIEAAHLKGQEAGRETGIKEAQATLERSKKIAQDQGYKTGYEDGNSIGYKRGVAEEQHKMREEGLNLISMRRSIEEKAVADYKASQQFKLFRPMISALPKVKAAGRFGLLYGVTPLVAGLFCQHFVSTFKDAKEENNNTSSKRYR